MHVCSSVHTQSGVLLPALMAGEAPSLGQTPGVTSPTSHPPAFGDRDDTHPPHHLAGGWWGGGTGRSCCWRGM